MRQTISVTNISCVCETLKCHGHFFLKILSSDLTLTLAYDKQNISLVTLKFRNNSKIFSLQIKFVTDRQRFSNQPPAFRCGGIKNSPVVYIFQGDFHKNVLMVAISKALINWIKEKRKLLNHYHTIPHFDEERYIAV